MRAGLAAEDSGFLAEADAVLSSMSPQVLSDLTDTVISTLNEKGSPVPTCKEVVRCQEEAKALLSDQQVPQGAWDASGAPPVPKKPRTMPSAQGCLEDGAVWVEALAAMHTEPPALTEPTQTASLPRDGWQVNPPAAVRARPKTSTVNAPSRTAPTEPAGSMVRDAQTVGQHDARPALPIPTQTTGAGHEQVQLHSWHQAAVAPAFPYGVETGEFTQDPCYPPQQADIRDQTWERPVPMAKFSWRDPLQAMRVWGQYMQAPAPAPQ